MNDVPPYEVVSLGGTRKAIIIDKRFILNVEFKPARAALRLPPEVIQLLLDILRQMPDDVEEQDELDETTKEEQEDMP